MTQSHADLNLLQDLISQAQRQGASAADALLVRSSALSVSIREGKTDLLERSESIDIGLRVIKGQRQAVIGGSNLSRQSLDSMVERALHMADATPEDPYCGLALPEQLVQQVADLDLADPHEPSPETLIEAAKTAEAAAIAVAGVSNSEGGDASFGRSDVALAASNGFAQSYSRTSANISATALAGQGTAMERDYDYDSAVYWADLRSAAEIGRRAGEITVKRLNPRRVSSQAVPVIFDARNARDLVGHFISAIQGASVARKATFLQHSLGKKVFADGVDIIEDPHIKRGLASRPFDGEGLPTTARHLIEDGTLTTWMLNLSSARQLGLKPTGHGATGSGSPPSSRAYNVWLKAGQDSVEAMIADIQQGLFLTDILGHGTNMVTGDYSRGASGFWIENGKIAYPVSELTIAGNLAEMFASLIPASDLNRRFGLESPSVLIPKMMVAGQ